MKLPDRKHPCAPGILSGIFKKFISLLHTIPAPANVSGGPAIVGARAIVGVLHQTIHC
jgi:hypothetical protein